MATDLSPAAVRRALAGIAAQIRAEPSRTGRTPYRSRPAHLPVSFDPDEPVRTHADLGTGPAGKL